MVLLLIIKRLLYFFYVFSLFSVTFTFAASVCHYPGKPERTFNAIVYGLFLGGYLSDGDILDVGAHHGEWACMYACFDQNRIVHAVDPSPKMIKKMRCGYSNMKKHVYAVSNTTGWLQSLDTPWGFTDVHNSSTGDVRIQTLDYLFLEEWKSIPAFLHIDVEGFELQALQGATKIINQYQPVFAIEAHVVENKAYTIELLKYVEAFKYSIFMVNEVCGMIQNCRNFICFPSKKRPNSISPVLDIAFRTKGLLKVTSSDIFEVYAKHEKAATSWMDTTVFPRPTV